VKTPVRDPATLAAIPGSTPGAASTALRGVLDRPRRPARVIAVFPSAVYLELRDAAEPRVVALLTSDALRLPNSVVIAPGRRDMPFAGIRETDEACVGDGYIDITAVNRLRVRVRRWWSPVPQLPPVPLSRLAQGAAALSAFAGESGSGLAGHPGPYRLADRCAAGDLAHAVDAAERIVGLGPGLTPSGDDILAGLLVSLRLLGEATPNGGAAVWLADWIGAAVTADADTRTTALAATLLHCAARGESGPEVGAVLRAVTGREPLGPAVRRLLGSGHTSGADLLWGVLAGCRAVQALGSAALQAQKATA
jgi:hypothetical protein